MSVDPSIMAMFGGAPGAAGPPAPGGAPPDPNTPPPGGGGPGMDPTAMGGGIPPDVASMFPSLDPQALGSIIGPALQQPGPGGIAQAFSQLLPMMEQDQNTLAQMQQQQLQQLIEMLMAPGGAPQPVQNVNPQVGGDTTGP